MLLSCYYQYFLFVIDWFKCFNLFFCFCFCFFYTHVWRKSIHSFPFVRPVSHLDAILGPLLQVRNNGVVPEVNEPWSKLLHSDRTGKEEARAWEDMTWETMKNRTNGKKKSKTKSVVRNSSSGYLWGSPRCCASPGKCEGDTRVLAPSPKPGWDPHWSGFSRSPTPSSSCASSAPGSHWPAPRCWRRSPFWGGENKDAESIWKLRPTVCIVADLLASFFSRTFQS